MPKRILQGKVVSDKTDKTIVVEVERRVSHPVFKKFVKKSKRFMAHDESNTAKTGDLVRIRESRPHSKRKRWELVTDAAEGADAAQPAEG
jgi:small subunit ribosomal protein S17